MNRRINNIMVPVDFTKNTKIAISKALEFCPEGSNSTIHLFHIQRMEMDGFSRLNAEIFTGYSQRQVILDMERSSRLLELLRAEIESEGKNIRVLCSVSFGERVQDIIIKKARQISADLVIIGKCSHHTLLPFLNTVVPSKLADATGIPVLTSKPGSLHQEIKTVVIPISNKFPTSKFEMIGMLNNKSRPQIRLVTFQDDKLGTSDSKHLLLQAFRAFRSQFSNPIYYEILEGSNRGRTLFRYCNRVGADILMVYPGAETRVSNWLNSHISDLLPAKSRTQILAVSKGIS